MATLRVPQVVPSPVEDTQQLRKAFVGLGTNEKTIISILAHRNALQRHRIRETYHETYGEDLLVSLKKEISGDFERAVMLWTLDQAERDAVLANEAVQKWHPGNLVLVEIACARSAAELFATRKAYQARYKRSLEEDVAAHTKGDFRKLLVPLVSSYRYDGPEVNTKLAKLEAKMLHKAIAEKSYSHEEIIRILGTRSKAQLIATFNHYNDEFGNPINKDLKHEAKDEFLSSLRAVIRCLVCPQRYFEKVLRSAIEGLGTDESVLSRVITTRAEADLQEIKEAYAKRNSKALDAAIAKDTSGDYEAFLLELIGHNEN
ncbi:annexin D2 [Dendrobium catenatum]|uniref:Annexin n=1 Tax=Dendrobium catenatum TaxID=906689 RepID=A0A2I0WZQ9_9ASPA|nr:annexin D2 [Dendrobium catenatum]PKU81148.1 Annexin D2 [Dendrobium catenatum]